MSQGMFPDSVEFPGTDQLLLGFPPHCAGNTLLQHSVPTDKAVQQLVGLAPAFGAHVGVCVDAVW